MEETPPPTQPAERSQAKVENLLAAMPAEPTQAQVENLLAAMPAETPPPQVENLVTTVQSEEAAATVILSGGRKTRLKKADIQACNFRQPPSFAAPEMRKLRLRHEEFIRALAAHLSIYLRLEVGMQLTKFEIVNYRDFAAALAQPTHLSLFKLEPLPGVCLLDMPLRLGLMFVDRLLGGPAQVAAANTEPSEIELALLDQVTLLFVNDWGRMWQKVENLRPVLVGHETSGRFLTTSAQDCATLVLAAEVRLGDCVAPVQIGFPLPTLEPLLRKAGRSNDAGDTASAPKAGRPVWNQNLNDVPIRITTQWPGLELSARQLAGLKPGDFLPLDPEWLGRLEVLVEQTPKFRARLGTTGDRWAAELTAPVKS